MRRMNASHSKLTDWGLEHIAIQKHYAILDVGCGGGRTVGKLAAVVTKGKVFGVDHSADSVALTRKTNSRWIAMGRVEVRQGSVSELPFAEGQFDLITAVETHFWWPNLPNDIREVFRVAKPGGQVALIAEIYKGANTAAAKLAEKYGAAATGFTLLSLEEHAHLLANAGFYEGVKVFSERDKGWMCAVARKPAE